MKEKLEALKKYAMEHKGEIAFAMFGAGCLSLGVIIGQWSIYTETDTYIGIGMQSAIEFVKANGIEAGEKAIRASYLVK